MRISQAGRRAGAQGYTLLELLIVMVLLVIGTMATASIVRSALPGVQLNASSATVASLLREARTIAIRDNREQRVMIDLDARTIQVGPQGRKYQLNGALGVSLYTALSEREEGERGAIRFFPDGSSTGGRVRLFADERMSDVVVNWLTGNVEIHERFE